MYIRVQICVCHLFPQQNISWQAQSSVICWMSECMIILKGIVI